ncbi:MAG: allantoate deiminase [Thermomicrobiales bacterium]|nr:allantoate deiminase [Thermomicrobiales bacterium]
MAVEPFFDALPRARTVMARCDLLARFSEEDDRLTRRYGTPTLRAAQDAVAGWMTVAGMTVRRDAIGNLIGRYGGEEARMSFPPSASRMPPLLIGGHLDTVRDAGKYDGTLGVLVGIACVERLRAMGEDPVCAVEIVAFADEEGLRFHTAYLGSWAFTGTLDPVLLERTDADGVTVAEAIRAFGGDPSAIVTQGHDLDRYLGFVEAHIEQGPVLEAEGLPVGVVAAIAGQTRVAVTFTGEAGHAGTVPMALRRDALCAAAEFVLAVEEVGRTTEGLVATVGQLAAEPGASNVVPGRVRLTLDVRHAADAVRREAVTMLLDRATAIARERGIAVSFENRNDNRAVACDPNLTARLAAAVRATGYPVRRLVSGAGHDAVYVARSVPTAMIFTPCKDGLSHNEAESIEPGEAEAGCQVLFEAVLARANRAL